jgi:hypothetical protein
MATEDEDLACDWCGDFADIAGPMQGVLCGDGSTLWLCEACLEASEDD